MGHVSASPTRRNQTRIQYLGTWTSQTGYACLTAVGSVVDRLPLTQQMLCQNSIYQ